MLLVAAALLLLQAAALHPLPAAGVHACTSSGDKVMQKQKLHVPWASTEAEGYSSFAETRQHQARLPDAGRQALLGPCLIAARWCTLAAVSGSSSSPALERGSAAGRFGRTER